MWFMILYTKRGKEIIIDSNHYSIAKDYTWNSKKTGRGDHEKIYTCINGKLINFNKIVFGLSDDECMTYKNGNCFDYSESNIQIVKKCEVAHKNGANKRIKSSRYHGVHFYSHTQKWWVRINRNEKAGSEHCYDLEEEAAYIADYLGICKYKNAANQNFPELSFREIEDKYNEIKEKYGYTKSERWARVMQGTSRCKSKSSRFIGVTEKKNRKKRWYARIKFNKKNIYIESFENEVDAARAYDKKATELYGIYAKLNFPDQIIAT